MSGSVTKPRIMFIFCRCPVDSIRTFAFRLSQSPKMCMSSSTSSSALRRRFFLPAKIRVRSRVSTAYDMGDWVHSLPDRAQASAGLDGQALPVSGDVSGNPVAHQIAPHVAQFGDHLLVVLEIRREFVRIELRELDRDSLDVRRPNNAQRFTPRPVREAVEGERAR